MSSNHRSEEAKTYRRLYKLARWQRLREAHLQTQPLCVFCQESGDVTAADVVDHIREHKGNESLFWNADNLQSLCASCHDRTKQRIELGQDVIRFDANGWPI